jgi:hypothetical protein
VGVGAIGIAICSGVILFPNIIFAP